MKILEGEIKDFDKVRGLEFKGKMEGECMVYINKDVKSALTVWSEDNCQLTVGLWGSKINGSKEELVSEFNLILK